MELHRLFTTVLIACLILGNVDPGHASKVGPPNATLELTAAEKQWLQAHSTIRIGVDPAYAPYSFRDDAGHYRGVALEFTDFLSRQLGITMEAAPDLSWPEIVDGVRQRRLDVVATMSHRPEREAFVNFTEIYLPTPLVIMRRSGAPINTEGDLDGRTVALVEGYSSSDSVIQAHPDAQPLMVKTALEGLFAVATGKAEAYVGVLGINLYLTQENGITNLEVAALYGPGINGQRFGVRKDWPELAAILDKALKSMTTADKRRLFARWLPAQAAGFPSAPQQTSSETIDLTAEEQSWLSVHPVIRVSSEPDYAPFDFRQNGEPAGYSIDYVRLLAKRLGIRIEFVEDTWGNLLDKARRRQVDLVHTIFKTPGDGRETYLNFTRPYKQTVDAIITHQENRTIHTIDDLKGQTLALVTGDAISDLVRQQYPELQVVEVSTYKASLTAVAFGQAEATIIELPVATHMMRSHLLTNLKVAAELKEIPGRDTRFRLAVRVDWPELIPILEKAMDAVTAEEVAALDNRWLALPMQEPSSAEDPSAAPASEAVLQIGLIASLFALMAWLLLRQLGRSQTAPLSIEYATGGARRFVLLLNALLVALVISMAWWALDRVKAKIQENMRHSLGTVLQTSMEGLHVWVKDQKERLDNFAADPRIGALASRQLARHRRGEGLLTSPDLASLREFFAKVQHAPGHIGFFLIAPDGTNIASMRDANVGLINPILTHRPEMIRRTLMGESVMVAPIPSDVPLEGAAAIASSDLPPTMFFASPIRGADDQVIAVLTERCDPHADFSRFALSGRIGLSGETYLFDLQGRLLSQSRFVHQLESVGLIQPGDQSILSIEIRDPGGNLMEGFRSTVPRHEQPFTRMAASAIQGQSAFDLDGYRDYRGVPVIGVWAWDASLGIGMAIEIDAAEAFSAYDTVRKVAFAILTGMVLLTLAFTVLTLLMGERANRALKVSRDQLEMRVEERTHELYFVNQRLALGLEAASMGIWDWDIRSDHISWDDKMFEIYGIPKKDPIRYEHWAAAVHPDDLVDAEMWVKRIVEDKETGFYEFRINLPDQTLRHISAAGMALTDDDGQAVRVIGSNIDITERKKLDREVLRAKEQAEAANQAKSIFLANMSHEIRTPMNAILGYSQIMQHDESLTHDQLKHLKIINRSGNHLLALINDVLEMSKIEAGRIDLTPAPFDLHALIRDVEMMFQLRCDEKRLHFAVEKDTRLPGCIEADEGKVRQVLINLLGNAVKFTRQGEIRLQVRWHDDSASETGRPGSQRRLAFAVRDTGPGIPKDMHEKIFGAFEQTDGGRQVEGGTGLGLAISRQYARMMDGDITVQSHLDQGSAFLFEMTAAESDAILPGPDRPDAGGAVLGLKKGQSPPRILVVDDRNRNVDILTQMLVRVGFQVTPAFNGQEAVDQFTRWRPQAVMMDIRMPVMDGVEATRRIRDLEAACMLELDDSDFCKTAIIAVSASALENQHKEIMQEGLADEFIGKPFKEAKILEALRRHLNIEYRHADPDTALEANETELNPEVAADAVARLPATLKSQLRQATVNLDVDRLKDLINQVRPHDGDLAAGLGQLVEGFDFDLLGKLMETPQQEKE